MKRRSETYGKELKDIFTAEAYEKLKRREAFRVNLETMDIEEIPHIITSVGDSVVFSIKTYCNNDFALINDFVSITFPYVWLEEMTHEQLLEKLKTDTNK